MTQGTEIQFRVVHGADIEPVLVELARLRMEVFREFPYLYDGEETYERAYLQSYSGSHESTVVLAEHRERVVGAATAMPLEQHSDDVVNPLVAAGFDPARVYYFGESVLLPAYRGRGIGHAFFNAREAAAQELGYATATFCAVVRPDDHPARPAGYAPHDGFWTRRGYQKRPDIVGQFAWRDVGHAHETSKPMVFWMKSL